ncbi:MAG: ABC transporter permease [Lachnospiraceae bacterium]|jgi:ribose transport system permease protein|nr:ABC transporter permease [Lachnospiraceae bacterium]
MTDKKQGNAFTNNPVVRAIGVQKIVVVIVLIAMILFFSAMSPAFRQYSTILSIMDYTYYLAFLGIGVTFCLITGGVDLSIGTGMFCYALIGGYLITQKHTPVIVGIIVTILCGLIMGTVNGLIVSKGGHAPFLATLCTMMIVRGLGAIITGGSSITWPGATAPNGWTRTLFKMDIGGTKVPLGFLWVMILAVAMSIFLNKTRPGRYIIAIGSNKEATRLSGVNVAVYQTIAYVISGVFTGLAALAYSSAFQSMIPGGGGGIELNAIGGAIIGGTSMNGGSGTIAGTILGVFIMSVLQTGLPLIGLQANYQQIIIGLVLIIAVYIDVLKNKKLA